MSKTLLVLTSILLTNSTAIRAEHRVGLLIDNHLILREDGTRVVDNLTRVSQTFGLYGFRTITAKNLDSKSLETQIRQFLRSTPTNSTAILYYRGQASAGNYKGQQEITLAGSNTETNDARHVGYTGFGIERIFRVYSESAGAIQLILLVDANLEKGLHFNIDVPAGITILLLPPDSLQHAKLAAQRDLISELISQVSPAVVARDTNAVVKSKGTPVTSPPDKLVAGKNAGDEWVNKQGMIFCWCPPGKFTMGSPAKEPGRHSDETLTEVTIASGFWISKYELTLRNNPRGAPPRGSLTKHKLDPISKVHYDDGKHMIQKTLNQQLAVSGWKYDLPTEQQWEYAARAGTRTTYSFGENPNSLPLYGNFADKSYYQSGDIFANQASDSLNDGFSYLAPVGSFKPNLWGLHDIHGNLAEWCKDNVTRGGSWASTPQNTRSAHRHLFGSRDQYNFLGYRIVINRE